MSALSRVGACTALSLLGQERLGLDAGLLEDDAQCPVRVSASPLHRVDPGFSKPTAGTSCAYFTPADASNSQSTAIRSFAPAIAAFRTSLTALHADSGSQAEVHLTTSTSHVVPDELAVQRLHPLPLPRTAHVSQRYTAPRLRRRQAA